MSLDNNLRFKEIDALRGIAALSVSVFHYTYWYNHSKNIYSNELFNWEYGHLGVQLFFIISGFVIFLTLEKSHSSLDFIVSRFSRMYPVYWVAIILTILFTGISSYSFPQVIANMTMLEYWFKIEYIDGSYWTLSVELTFYALMWILYVTKQLKNIVVVCYLWLAMSIVVSTTDFPIEYFMSRLFILKHAAYFVGGIGFYLLTKNKYSLSANALAITSLVTALILAFINHSGIVFATTISSFYIVFYMIVWNKTSFIANKALLMLGSISYSYYLIHQKIGFLLIDRIKNIVDNQLIYVAFTMLVNLSIAFLLTRFVEQPALKWIRNTYNSSKKKTSIL